MDQVERWGDTTNERRHEATHIDPARDVLYLGVAMHCAPQHPEIQSNVANVRPEVARPPDRSAALIRLTLACSLWIGCRTEAARSPEPTPDLAIGNLQRGGPDETMPSAEPRTLETLPNGRVTLGPFSLVVPKEWTGKPVTLRVRAAHFLVSVIPNEQAELVVYYFGPSGGGSVAANLDRWIGQLVQPDGRPSRTVAKIENSKVAGQDATLLSVNGRFTASQLNEGSPPIGATGATIGAIVSSPVGHYYFKLTGAKVTVDAHAARFKAMLDSMQLK